MSMLNKCVLVCAHMKYTIPLHICTWQREKLSSNNSTLQTTTPQTAIRTESFIIWCIAVAVSVCMRACLFTCVRACACAQLWTVANAESHCARLLGVQCTRWPHTGANISNSTGLTISLFGYSYFINFPLSLAISHMQCGSGWNCIQTHVYASASHTLTHHITAGDGLARLPPPHNSNV